MSNFKNGHVNYINNYRNINDINNNNNQNRIQEQEYKTFYYVGQHVDGCDSQGPIIVYHYMSEEMRNGRNLNTINEWDYDLELWPGDRYWREAGRGKPLTIEADAIPY